MEKISLWPKNLLEENKIVQSFGQLYCGDWGKVEDK